MEMSKENLYTEMRKCLSEGRDFSSDDTYMMEVYTELVDNGQYKFGENHLLHQSDLLKLVDEAGDVDIDTDIDDVIGQDCKDVISKYFGEKFSLTLRYRGESDDFTLDIETKVGERYVIVMVMGDIDYSFLF